jgi:hypothetical protein
MLFYQNDLTVKYYAHFFGYDFSVSKLNSEKCIFYEEKSLVGLTLGNSDHTQSSFGKNLFLKSLNELTNLEG